MCWVDFKGLWGIEGMGDGVRDGEGRKVMIEEDVNGEGFCGVSI